MINNHIVLPSFEPGTHAIDIEFVAGENSLNRNEEYLYTLFVPDRASFAIPLFDQPNLKARYRLTLEISFSLRVGWGRHSEATNQLKPQRPSKNSWTHTLNTHIVSKIRSCNLPTCYFGLQKSAYNEETS